MKKVNINFKHPKYVIPLFVFVFANFFFYVFSSSDKETKEVVVVGGDDLQYSVGTASNKIQSKELESKFEAYQKNYNLENRGSQVTAINRLGDENIAKEEFDNLYNEDEIGDIAAEDAKLKRMEEELRRKQQEIASGGYVNPSTASRTGVATSEDEQVMEMLRLLSEPKKQNEKPQTPEVSPLEAMKEQYRFLDSLEKASNPELQAIEREEERQRKILKLMEEERLSKLTVTKLTHNAHFNTIMKEKESEFIKAIIDEDITGYAGSRIKIRLLEPIKVGNYVIDKGAYLYAIITGFNEQRVRLDIVSVMHRNNILPIRLSIYDVDGMEGLYVPNSQFREFTKQLGGSTMQGMNMNSTTGDMKQQFFTSLIDRAFTSTSTTIANLIRKNKAKLKYNTFIYLIDKEALDKQKEQIYKQNTK